MTSKQRAFLRAQANGLEAILHAGKGGVSDAMRSKYQTVSEEIKNYFDNGVKYQANKEEIEKTFIVKLKNRKEM